MTDHATSPTAAATPAAAPSRYLLPPAAYADRSWFEAEQEHLFERSWVLAGVEHDLAAPGDTITVQVGRAPVLVVRGADGGLRAFHNVCRHRGMPLVDGDGNCGRALVCPYHRWSYGLDGALRSVPQADRYPPELPLDELGLAPVRVEVWKTLVFVHLDLDAPPLADWLGDLDPLFPNFHPEELVEVSDQTHEVASNWKLYVENHVDWLHLWYLHADTLAGYDHRGGERLELGPHWASFEHLRQPEPEPESEPDASPDPEGRDTRFGLLPIPGLSRREACNGAHFVFPSLTLFTNAGYWMLGQVLPVDPGAFKLRLRVFAVEGSVGSEFEPTVNQVMFEDYGVTEAIQRAVRSPAYAVGPLATDYEREIMRFHQHYLDRVPPPSGDNP